MTNYTWQEGYNEGYNKGYADGMAHLQEKLVLNLLKFEDALNNEKRGNEERETIG